MAMAQPALGKCAVCGDQLLEIRPFTPDKKTICPTCTYDELQKFKTDWDARHAVIEE
jgi:formylmethanofuran dehydrogenase subunit E